MVSVLDPTAVIAGVLLPASGPSDAPSGCLLAVPCHHPQTCVSRPPIPSLLLYSPYHYAVPTTPLLSSHPPLALSTSPSCAWLCVLPFLSALTLDPLMGNLSHFAPRFPNYIPYQRCRGAKWTAIPHNMDERRLRWDRYL